MRLFSWRRALLPLAIGIAVVSYRSYESYRKKGRLDPVDVGAAVVTILMLVGILLLVGWWANRRE